MSAGKFVKFHTLDENTQQLIVEGSKVREHSYSPYSKFRVGSALRCADGIVRSGCNVENAAFSVSLCAERCAVGKAVSEGQHVFREISVVAERIDGRITSPCGMCRQMLAEFGDFPVYLASPALDEVLVSSTHALLPYAFQKGSKDHFNTSNCNDKS